MEQCMKKTGCSLAFPVFFKKKNHVTSVTDPLLWVVVANHMHSCKGSSLKKDFTDVHEDF